MKKVMLCMVACVALFFASCEPRIEYVEVPVEVPVEIDTSNMPDSLKIFMNTPKLKEKYEQELNWLRQDLEGAEGLPRVHRVIVSYGNNPLTTNPVYKDGYPQNFIYIQAFQQKTDYVIEDDKYFFYKDWFLYKGTSLLRLSDGEAELSFMESVYKYPLNRDFYNSKQYVYDVIDFNRD